VPFDKIFQAKWLIGCHYFGRNTVLLSCKIFSEGQWMTPSIDVFCLPIGEANTQRSYSLQLCGLSLAWELWLWKMKTAGSSVAVTLSKPSHEDFILYLPWPVKEMDPCGASFANWTLKFLCGKTSIGVGVRDVGAPGPHTQNQRN
jgi:hypothetical protein